MTKSFDDKLTTLTKKFHILDVACVRDTLESCEGNVEIATEFLRSMVEQDVPDSLPQDDSEDDDELRRALEISAKEENEKQAILEALSSSSEDQDISKSDIPPDPPPPIDHPITFAQQAREASKQPIQTVKKIEQQPQPTFRSQNEIKDGYNLYVMRGLPGSGKSTLAENLVKAYNEATKKAIICSADDFFMDHRGNYMFDPNRLSEAHEFCMGKADKFMKKGFEAVIIDNTNTEIWQMIPYAKMALSFRYRISIEEPNTVWKLNVRELARRNRHSVPQQRISIMKQNWEMCTTTELVKIARGVPIIPPGPAFRPMVPLQPFMISPGSRFILPGPPIMPRHGGPRMPLRPMGPIQSHSCRLKTNPTPRPPAATPPPKQQLPQPTQPIKVKFQMQANVVNVPETVRENMEPAPDKSEPERFRCPPIADQEQALRRSRTSSKSNSNEDSDKSSPKPNKPEETLIPANLLLEQDLEDSVDNPANMPDERPQPIGHGRRNRGRHSSSHADEDFDFLSSIPNDWTTLSNGVWSDKVVMKDDKKGTVRHVGVQTGEVPTTKSTVITATGDYQMATGAAYSGNSWKNFHDWEGQTVLEEIVAQTSPHVLEYLKEMFPKISETDLRQSLSDCGFNEDRAIDTILSGQFLGETEIDDFELDPALLDAIHRLDTPEVPNSHQSQPVLITDENFFHQLSQLFGAPPGVLNNFAAIPQTLAKEIYDWWLVSCYTAPPVDHTDEQLALSLQEIEISEQCSQVTERKVVEDEFPSLVRGQKPAKTTVGVWGQKGLSNQLKIERLEKLFPSLPKDRLQTFLDDNNGSMEHTIQLICEMTGKPLAVLRQQQLGEPSRDQAHPRTPVHEEEEADRDHAWELRTRAHEYKVKAGEAHRKRQGQLAHYYASEADRLGSESRRAQQNAAETIFVQNNERFSGQNGVYDFHGLHRDEAIRKLKQILEANHKGDSIIIITGQGKHSKGNKAKVSIAVDAYLSQHDYHFTRHNENRGVVKVTLRKK